MEFLPTISLTKAFSVEQMILCKFGQICATGNAFVRLIVGRNSISNFPPKIWTGMCKALLCGDDSSHSQGQSEKRLLLASRGISGSDAQVHWSCIDPTYLSHTLNLILKAPGASSTQTSWLLKMDPMNNTLLKASRRNRLSLEYLCI